MRIALRTPTTLEEFLAWEYRQELRYEFDGFQPIAMTGGTLEHSAIQINLVVKNAQYQATPSIRRYVVLEQTHAWAKMFARNGADWVSEVVAGDHAVLPMPEIVIEIPLAELYADVDLGPDPSAG